MNARRCCETAGSSLPALALAFLPKCPACLAAWIAAGAGIGISAGAAARLRLLLILLSLAPILYVAIRQLVRVRARA